jgi:hypothetical protein
LVRRKLPIWPHSMACLRSSSDGFMGYLPEQAFLPKKLLSSADSTLLADFR